VKSPDWAARYLAVESLAKLGPEAVPLLEVASGDADHRVRARAADALRANRSGDTR
jgi:HEAT repeat protein